VSRPTPLERASFRHFTRISTRWADNDAYGHVVETGCSYFAPLAFPGEVDVGLAVERLGTSSVTYRIGVFASGVQECAAQGHFTHVYVDRASRRPTPLPENWRMKLATLA
jgi:acyl-CoA thioester hydrolase